MTRNALGRGLSALLSDEGPIPQPKTPPQIAEGQAQVPVGRIRPNRFQPRQELDQEAIQELADSIKVHGLLQPIVVSYDAEEDEYELIAGERRLEAAKHLGMKTIPAVDLLENDPKALLRRVVYGMLPANKLRKERLKRLKMFTSEEKAAKETK